MKDTPPSLWKLGLLAFLVPFGACSALQMWIIYRTPPVSESHVESLTSVADGFTDPITLLGMFTGLFSLASWYLYCQRRFANVPLVLEEPPFGTSVQEQLRVAQYNYAIACRGTEADRAFICGAVLGVSAVSLNLVLTLMGIAPARIFATAVGF